MGGFPLAWLVLGLLAGLTGRAPQQTGLDRLIPPSPAPAGFIADGGPMLSVSELAQLNQRISTLQASGRGDIGVAILRNLGDYPPYEVGTAIYRAWRIGSVDSLGSARRDLGVLLLIVPKEIAVDGKGQCWITTGRGAEGVITDATAARICRDSIIPPLRAKAYAGAIDAGISAITDAIAHDVPAGTQAGVVSAPQKTAHRLARPLAAIFALILGLLGIGGGIVKWRMWQRRRPRSCPKGHGPMRLLDETADDAALAPGQRKEESLHSVDYDVWECPSCGERVVLQYRRWMSGYSQCPTCSFWTLKVTTRTIQAATTHSSGLAETTKKCENCGWTETKRHTTAPIASGSSSGGSGGSSSSGSSFGGSGATSGGGGGSSY